MGRTPYWKFECLTISAHSKQVRSITRLFHLWILQRSMKIHVPATRVELGFPVLRVLIADTGVQSPGSYHRGGNHT